MNNPKKKIIHLIQSLDSGGCENMLLRTLPLLADFEHKIITLKHPGELAEKFKEKNITVINIGQKGFLDIPSYVQLLKTIKEIRPNLIITYLFHADAVGRLFLQIFINIKVIPFLRTTYNHKKYKLARLFEKITEPFVKNYLANSQSVKDFYVKNIGVPSEKIAVITNSINVDFYDKIERDEYFREELAIKKEEIAIICVANLHINKGHEYLLEAFDKIYKENQKIKLLLVGDGEEKESLRKQAENYQSKNNILFLGKRSDVPRLLKISDIFVLPTMFEGMSTAIMEAMACRLPIITTDILENKELIKNNESGILIPVKNSIELKNSLEKIIENNELKIELGRMAQKEILNRFEISIVLNKLSNTLNDF